MSAQRQYGYTPEEYLEIERRATIKSEYYGGKIYAMSGASEVHGLIATNISSEFRVAFKRQGKRCRVIHSDVRISAETTGLFTYADVGAICEPSVYVENQKPDTLKNPLLLVEVLSPSTEAYDRGRKFANYREIPTLQEYVLVAQNEACVESYHRQSDGQTWLLTSASGLDAVIELRSIGVQLALSEVYENVTFATEPSLHLDNVLPE